MITPLAPVGRVRPAPALSPLDVAYGLPLGRQPGAARVERTDRLEPIEAIEAVIARALRRPPCLVSFSGGRDSSALLALAARVARDEGYPPPVPATLRFPEAPESDETDYQELLVRRLELPDWLRIVVTGDDLDIVGPFARAALLRHGIFWPFNAHFHLPIFDAARGGSVITGFGGDEVARASAGARAEQVLARRRAPRLEDALVVGLALSPRPLRAAVYRRRSRGELEAPWLTPFGRQRVLRALASEEASSPFGWARLLRSWLPRRRYFALCVENFQVLADAQNVAVVHPFVDDQVLAALAGDGGVPGYGSRTQLMRALFGAVLPEEILARTTKAGFTSPTWTDTARSFAAEWTGSAVDQELVDPDALRRHWLGEPVNLLSATLLQQAWLHDHPQVPAIH